MKVTLKCYPDGYLRKGHLEMTIVDPEDIRQFKSFSKEKQFEILQDYGEFILDDYELSDMGITNDDINKITMED